MDEVNPFSLMLGWFDAYIKGPRMLVYALMALLWKSVLGFFRPIDSVLFALNSSMVVVKLFSWK